MEWWSALACLSTVAAGLRVYVYRKKPSAEYVARADGASPPMLASLRARYLLVMLTVRFADWLQGPYFYEVYSTKVDSRTGAVLTPGAVSTLFLAGFCSSMLFGTLAGSLTDTFGR